MKKSLKQLLSLALVAMLFICAPSLEVLAAEEIQTVDDNVMQLDSQIVDIIGNPDISFYASIFEEASITVTGSDEGMQVQIVTSMNGVASVVGVKDVVIQKKVWYGWSTVATIAGGASTNAKGSICTMLYPEAVKGETYRITCTHYGNVDGYREMSNDSGSFNYVY